MRFTVKSTTTLILASKSPRRIELMTLAGFDFLSVPAVKEEKITGGTSPSDAVLNAIPTESRGDSRKISL